MTVGILRNSHYGLCKYAQVMRRILDYNKIDVIELDINDVGFWRDVLRLDLFVYRWNCSDNHHQIALAVIPIIEKELGVKCLPNTATCWHYDDKIRQYYLLRAHGFPITESWVFYGEREALKWAEQADFPVVFKLKGGAGSSNVILVKSSRKCRRIIRRMFGNGVVPAYSGFGDVQNAITRRYLDLRHWIGQKLRGEETSPCWQVNKNYVLFQKFLRNNDYDTRVTVIGGRAFAFRRLNRVGDFRSSGSGRIDYDVKRIDLSFVAKALEISRVLGFQSMAYDSLYDENQGVSFCEISYTFVASAVYRCPGYWDENLQWHGGHFLPQYLQLVDMLGDPELKQPDME